MNNRPWSQHYDYSVQTTIRYPRIPAYQLAMGPMNSFPNKPACNFYGTEISYWELRSQVLRMSNSMGALGVKKGDRIGIHLPNCPQYIIAYLASLTLGAVVVNLNPMYTVHELKAIVNDTKITTLFSFGMVLDTIRELKLLERIPRTIITEVTDFVSGVKTSTAKSLDLNSEEGWYHFSQLIEDCSSTKLPKVDFSPDDPALIQFTGGTTGVPKGAVLTHGNIVAATMQSYLWGSSVSHLTPPEKQSTLSVLPLFHVYGTIVAMNLSFLNCATQILVPRFEIDEIMGILEGFEQITFFPAVPTMINAVINHPRANEMDLGKKIGLLNSGGGPMPNKLIEQTKDMGIVYGEGWGMSETTSLGISNPLMGLKKDGSIGIPFPDTDIRLVNPDNTDEDVSMGEPGEILIKSPLIMKEYWNNPEETALQLKDGWLNTGDIAVMDEDHFLFIVDRKKDMIIAGGYNIYPREIDEVLYQHPKIIEAVAVGIPHDYRGETVKAFIVTKPGEELTEEDIIEFCKEKMAAYKVPKSIEFRDDIPKSAVGKILRKTLRDEEMKKR